MPKELLQREKKVKTWFISVSNAVRCFFFAWPGGILRSPLRAKLDPVYKWENWDSEFTATCSEAQWQAIDSGSACPWTDVFDSKMLFSVTEAKQLDWVTKQKSLQNKGENMWDREWSGESSELRFNPPSHCAALGHFPLCAPFPLLENRENKDVLLLSERKIAFVSCFKCKEIDNSSTKITLQGDGCGRLRTDICDRCHLLPLCMPSLGMVWY